MVYNLRIARGITCDLRENFAYEKYISDDNDLFSDDNFFDLHSV